MDPPGSWALRLWSDNTATATPGSQYAEGFADDAELALRKDIYFGNRETLQVIPPVLPGLRGIGIELVSV